MCEELQLLYWRTMFQLPKGTPKVMMRAETLSLMMKQRIWKMKLLLAKSILTKEGSLARAVYLEQVKNNWPGLSQEVKEICRNIGIDNINDTMVDKDTIEEAIFYHNYKEMKIDMQRYEKLEDEKDKDFTKLPCYMEGKGLEDIRLAFRIKSKMVRKIKMNYKKSYYNLVCEMCQSGRNESQCHAMECPGWQEHRSGLDLAKLEDMVIFFKRILEDKDRARNE